MNHVHVDATFLIAILLVCIYATSRFNTPRAARSQTSQLQYVGSCVAYVLSSSSLFIILTWLLMTNPEALNFLHFGASTPLPAEVSQFAAPLIIALAMTTLLPSFPMLREIDTKLLRFFHRIGRIPIAATRWSKQMEQAQFVISPDLLTEMQKHISNSRVLADDTVTELRTDPSKDSARYRFTRNLALYVALSNLDGQTRFYEDYPEETTAFEKTIVSYFAQSAGFFALTRQVSLQQLDSLPEPIKNARDGYKSLCHDVYEEIRLMLARVMLYSSSGQHEVARRLASLGFIIQRPEEIRISANLLALDAIGVVALFAVATLLAAGNGLSISAALSVGCLVAVNHSIAAICAMVPKQLWGFADIRSAAERPILAYILSGFSTFMMCLPISFGFWLLRPLLSLPPLPFCAQCKWLLLPITMAAVLGFECDDFVAANREPAWLRWIEGAALSVIMAMIGFFTVQWIYEGLGNPIPPRVFLPILLSASMGFLFGATIPNGNRKILRHARSRDSGSCEVMSPASGAGTLMVVPQPMHS